MSSQWIRKCHVLALERAKLLRDDAPYHFVVLHSTAAVVTVTVVVVVVVVVVVAAAAAGETSGAVNEQLLARGPLLLC